MHAREQSWRDAWAQAGNQQRNSKAALAIDAIATYPVIFATTPAAKLSMSIQATYVLLERFVERGLIVDVTRRSARQLLALKDFTPLRESVWKLRKPLPGRKRSLPRASDIMKPKKMM